MNSKYDAIVRPERYWESASETEQDVRSLLLMLIKKVDQLNERVYEAQVRSEDAYQEVVRLHAETEAQIKELKELKEQMDNIR